MPTVPTKVACMRFGRRRSRSPSGRRNDATELRSRGTPLPKRSSLAFVRCAGSNSAMRTGWRAMSAPSWRRSRSGTSRRGGEAWNELWGNVHHQGTVYEATVPAVEVLADLAGWDEFPDRREALCMLGAFAGGDGSRADEVRAAVRARAIDLVARWRNEPTLIQRALLMLSRSADVVDQELRESVLPSRYAASWALGTSGDIWARFGDEEPLGGEDALSFDAAMDGLSELEDWAFSQD